jgi:hypothetical protein
VKGDVDDASLRLGMPMGCVSIIIPTSSHLESRFDMMNNRRQRHKIDV